MKKVFLILLTVITLVQTYAFEHEKLKPDIYQKEYSASGDLVSINSLVLSENISESTMYYSNNETFTPKSAINQNLEIYSLRCWYIARKVKSAIREVGMSKEDAELLADTVKLICEVLT